MQNVKLSKRCPVGAFQGMDVGDPGRRSRESIRQMATRFPRELCPGLSKRCPVGAKYTPLPSPRLSAHCTPPSALSVPFVLTNPTPSVLEPITNDQ